MREKVAEPLGLGRASRGGGHPAHRGHRHVHAVKAVTTERGLDAGSFTMVVYGGAGPLHASAIAREIGIRRVLIPYSPGYFSAYGMLFSDLRYDYVRSCFRRLADMSTSTEIEALYAAMEGEGTAAVERHPRSGPESVVIERAADMRYVGQEHAVTVDLPREFFERGPRGDQEAFRRDARDALRHVGARRAGRTRQPAHHRAGHHAQAAPAHRSRGRGRTRRRRRCAAASRSTSARRLLDTPVYERDAPEGRQPHRRACADRGTCLHDRLVQPGDTLEVDTAGNLQITIGSDAR